MYCLRAESGEVVWKFAIEDQIRCSPTIAGDRAFLAGCDAKLHVVDLEAGASAGAVEIDGPTGVTPAARGDRVYFGTESGTFYAIDWKNQEVVWDYQPAARGTAYRSSAAVTDELAIVGSRSKRVLALEVDSGEIAWEFVTKRPVDSSPVVVGDRVYVGSDEGRLYGLKLANGEKVWEYDAGGGFASSPAVSNGRLVIASNQGVVYCFGKAE